MVIRLAAFLLLLMGAAGAAALKTWHKVNIEIFIRHFNVASNEGGGLDEWEKK